MYTVVLPLPPPPLQSRKVYINFLKAALSYILELMKSVFFFMDGHLQKAQFANKT